MCGGEFAVGGGVVGGAEMKLFKKASDGGKDSGVTGFFLVEIKPLFSVVLLRFRAGSREAFHSHAFNAFTWFVLGRVAEQRRFESGAVITTPFYASFKPKYTSRENCHRVYSVGVTWALSFRGPWKRTWKEYKNGKFVTLTHGRKVIDDVATDH